MDLVELKGMGLYFDFNTGWILVWLIIYLPYLALLIERKSYQNKKELKSQFIFAIIALLISFILEFVGVSFKLWTNFPGNWSIYLWIAYFGGGLLSFQLIKKIEELV